MSLKDVRSRLLEDPQNGEAGAGHCERGDSMANCTPIRAESRERPMLRDLKECRSCWETDTGPGFVPFVLFKGSSQVTEPRLCPRNNSPIKVIFPSSKSIYYDTISFIVMRDVVAAFESQLKLLTEIIRSTSSFSLCAAARVLFVVDAPILNVPPNEEHLVSRH